MNEIQSIDNLTVEILILKQQTAQNIIEIGKRLIEVQQQLGEGESFRNWLKEKVQFSKSTAYNFVRAAKEFSTVQALGQLGQTKVFALLDIPPKEREEFVSTPHEVNGEVKTVDEMTTRELQKVIKERDEALKEKEIYASAARKAEDAKFISDNLLRESKENAKADIKKLKDSLKDEKEKSSKEIAKIQAFIGEAKDAGNNEEVEILQASLKESQNDLDISAQKIDELEAKLKEKPIDVTETIIEKIPEQIQRELEELRNKNGETHTQPVIKFKIYFEELQNIFRNELEVMDEIKEAYPETYEKCKGAISNLISKMAERL